jgi:hypothetical protein
MKRIINLTLILAIMVIIYGVQTASAQTEKQLQFAKGKSSATVKGTTGTNGVYYNLRAKGGQKITVTLTPKSGIGIKIERGADEVLLREESGGTYTVYLEEGGDFSIFLGSVNHKSQAYTLTVSITKMKDI